MDNYKITATGRFDENGEHHLTFNNGTEAKDPALISGVEALRALADGKEIEYLYCDEEWIDASELQVKHFNSDCFTFRIKKRLIQIDGNEYTKEGAYAYLDKFYGGSTQ